MAEQDAPGVEERLAALEVRVARVEADNAQLRRVLGAVRAALGHDLLSSDVSSTNES